MTAIVADGTALHGAANAELVARLARLPVTPRLLLIRVIVGIATFFDGYTVLAIAFAMPSLVSEWKLTPTEVAHSHFRVLRADQGTEEFFDAWSSLARADVVRHERVSQSFCP